MRPFHSVLRTEPVSNPRRDFFSFFLIVHEIWMLFISPANPDFSSQTPSTGKHYHWQKKEEKLQK